MAANLGPLQRRIAALEALERADRAARGPSLSDRLSPLAIADLRQWQATRSPESQFVAVLNGTHPLNGLFDPKFPAEITEVIAAQEYQRMRERRFKIRGISR